MSKYCDLISRLWVELYFHIGVKIANLDTSINTVTLDILDSSMTLLTADFIMFLVLCTAYKKEI